MNKEKLRNLLKVLDPQKLDFSAFDNAAKTLKEKLTEQIQVKTLEDVNVALEKNRKRIDFEPLTQAFEQLKTDWTTGNESLIKTLNEKQTELQQKILEINAIANKGYEGLKQEIEALNAEIAILAARKVEIPDFGKQIKNTEAKLIAMIQTAKDMDSLEDEVEKAEVQKQFLAFEKQIKDLKLQFQMRGGGSMNRQIFIGGADPLKRYTDINLKAGSNVTLTYANNDTTKQVDVTVAATGGAGTVRNIKTITVTSTIGTLAGTDQVILANGGVQITLPTAVSDTNLYTIKNVGTSSVLINTTASQTIDGQSTIIMPVQYTSVDLVSDNTNWDIT